MVFSPKIDRIIGRFRSQKDPHQSLPHNSTELQDQDKDVPSKVRQSMTQATLQDTPDVDLEDWKAGRSEWMIIIVMAVVSLMVALDATILVPVLPVSYTEV